MLHAAMVDSGNTRGRRRAPVWRVLVVLAVVSLVIVGMPVMASAARPSSTTTTGADFFCESEVGFLGVNVFEDPEFGEVFLDVFFEPFGEPFVLSGFTEDADFDGTTVHAEVEMFLEEGSGNGEENGENGEPELVGVAIIDATWDPTGETEVFTDRFRDGNRWVEFRDTFTQAHMAGFAFLEDFFDYDLGDCDGSVFESVMWTTNPNAYNNRFSGRFLECALSGPDGEGFLIADAGDFGSFMGTDIFFGDGRWLSGITEEFVFTDTEVSGTIELFDNDLGEPAGEAVVDAVLEPNLRNLELIHQDGWIKVVEQYFDVTGTVDAGGSTFDMIECFSVAFDVREHFSNPSGPKPTGKAPANDTPEGALSLEDRGTTNAQTNGAANAPEADCIFSFDGEEPEEFPLPIGKTLWYTFEGTGGEVTVDSAGSNFDTIVGLYDAEMTQIACVDDVETETSVTLQAAATIETDAGATYYVQIGGFGFFEEDGEVFLGEFGRIRLNMS